MTRYLWIAHLALASLAGWGGLTWLVVSTGPQVSAARLGFVLALAIGLYATACMLAYALCLLRWPAAPRFVIHAFSRRQGFMWSAFLSTLVLLRLAGEMSLATVVVACAAFLTAEYTQLRHAA
ncbi:MAG: hypothetical protein ACYC3S_12110 [Chloroflexota bacterium]